MKRRPIPAVSIVKYKRGHVIDTIIIIMMVVDVAAAVDTIIIVAKVEATAITTTITANAIITTTIARLMIESRPLVNVVDTMMMVRKMIMTTTKGGDVMIIVVGTIVDAMMIGAGTVTDKGTVDGIEEMMVMTIDETAFRNDVPEMIRNGGVEMIIIMTTFREEDVMTGTWKDDREAVERRVCHLLQAAAAAVVEVQAVVPVVVLAVHHPAVEEEVSLNGPHQDARQRLRGIMSHQLLELAMTRTRH